MTFTIPDKTFKKIKQGDPDFNIGDGIKIIPRASFEIGEGCPQYFKTIIAKAYSDGWLIPVAYMKESEYVWEKLGD
jgi:hypothetical protein